MGMLHIFARGEDELTQRFEDAMYDIMDASEEVCEIYEQMKSQFSERGGEAQGAQSGVQGGQMHQRGGYPMQQRMASRMNHRSRDSRGRWI